jgi:hypothetical protein
MSYSDLHMTIIFPEDITERVSSFISGNTIIPFVKKDGLLSLLYLYGMDHVVLEKPERVLEIANKTVETLEKSIVKYRNCPKSLFDLQYSQNNYTMNFNLIIP